MKEKHILQSKTFWVNGITLAIGAATLLSGNEAGLSSESTAILTTLVIPALHLVLRAITNEPVTTKLKPKRKGE